MNGYRSIRFPRKRIFIIDELALVLAFFSAILIRYRSDARYWAGFFDGLYVSVLVVAVLMQAIIFLVYDSRRPSLFVQDRVQGLFYIIKGRMILLIFIILYLYMTQKGVDSSRFVIGATIMLNVFYDYILRNIIKSQYFSRVGELKEKILELSFPFPSDEEIRKKISEGDISKVLIHPGDAAEEEIERVISVADVMGIHPFVGLKSLGYDVRSGIVRDISDYASIPVSVRKERFDIFGVHYAVARVEEAVLHVKRHVKELKGEYICFSNVHTLVMARENPDYARVLNESAFAFPDGAPIAQLQQKSGMELAERVAGPDFMEHMFKASTDGSITHYFYGASQNTLDELNKKLLEKYPGIVIKGMYSPPFRELTPEEDQRDVDMINASGADILWVGLGAPKQEKWMNAHKGRINAVMMGVGAGFDFHAGTINRAPLWIQKIGFEWLYRLFQDPKRLIRRYFITNTKYMWYLMLAKIKRQ
jgi:exopolysaccharide biosynthesis WecB/TagA/CpsF family protein